MSVTIGGIATCWVCDADAKVVAGPHGAVLDAHRERPPVTPDDGRPMPQCEGGGKTRSEQMAINWRRTGRDQA